MNSRQSDAAVCFVPRERFSCAVQSLQNIVDNTATGFTGIYIDANSPPEVSAQLQTICYQNNITYIRKDHYLTPNQARNIALAHNNATYVAFVDNDLFVKPGWLEALVACARETGAWAVSPVILEGSNRLSVIHMTGGDLVEEQVGGYNRVRQRHRHMFETLASTQKNLCREPVGSFEFHCVLVRTDVFDSRCFLDEDFLSLQEHLDLAREIRRAGGEVYFEPHSIVRYDNAQPFQDYDKAYFELRWSEDWTQKSIEHCRRKWGLADNDSGLNRVEQWTTRHRSLFELSQTSWERHILPIVMRKKVSTWLRKRKLLPEQPGY